MRGWSENGAALPPPLNPHTMRLFPGEEGSASPSHLCQMHEKVIFEADRLNASGLRIGLAVSRYHGSITEALRDGAIREYIESGGNSGNLGNSGVESEGGDSDLTITSAAGSFELVAICNGLVRHTDLHGILALGCIITGETPHDKYLAHAVAQGLTQITVQTGLPIGFGVLTCRTIEQARERAGGSIGNKGAEAMAALIHTIHTLRTIAQGKTGGIAGTNPS